MTKKKYKIVPSPTTVAKLMRKGIPYKTILIDFRNQNESRDEKETRLILEARRRNNRNHQRHHYLMWELTWMWNKKGQLSEAISTLIGYRIWKEGLKVWITSPTKPMTKTRWFKKLTPEFQKKVVELYLETHITQDRTTTTYATPTRIQSLVDIIQNYLEGPEQKKWQSRFREHLQEWERKLAAKRRPKTEIYRRSIQRIPKELGHRINPQLLAHLL